MTTALTIPGRASNMNRQMIPPITSGTVHGSSATTRKNHFPLMSAFSRSATDSPSERWIATTPET